MRIDNLEHLPRAASHLLALFACGLIVGIGLPLRGVLDLANIAMLMLLTVVFAAALLGRSPAILASFLCVAAFDFFFVPPRLSFVVSDVQYLVTFAVMLVVSLVISHLTTRLQASTREALAREQLARALYALAKALAGAMSAAQVVRQVGVFVREQAGGEARFFLPDEGERLGEFPAAGHPLGLDESLVLEAVFRAEAGEPSSCVAGPGGVDLYLPLNGATRRRGVLVVRAEEDEDARLPVLRPMLEGVASLTAIALERLHFVEVAQASQLEMAAERLRASILSSISHDLRTPLTVLFGRADALALAGSRLGDEEREAAGAIRDQAGRLHQMVENLLDMARLQAGQVRLRKDWHAIDEVIGASIRLLGEALREHPVKVGVAPELPLVALDAVLMERVFCNLIENAAKYSPAGAPVAVDVASGEGGLVIEVRNAGPGFPPGSLARVFHLFERGAPESPAAGAGLGLAICRAIVEAHGGHIVASNPPEGGACVRFTLPSCGEPPRIEPELADPAGAGS
ncbi:DUF4118 domain-containing protein [Azoarcus sp. DN11]|uniref:DUF4118 domain-containing protein n=1 Tax=Azoarcus sp. DN11 TaxID=356837 RepID=UPI000EB5773D|nr:DUF4118 domain-containing protein [Azoarcus sp. DN11]AYH45604.1 sensor for high-affinity potassium transporter [Azoarcus sp. DN11]